jgi:hypothetical protein
MLGNLIINCRRRFGYERNVAGDPFTYAIDSRLYPAWPFWPVVCRRAGLAGAPRDRFAV